MGFDFMLNNFRDNYGTRTDICIHCLRKRMVNLQESEMKATKELAGQLEAKPIHRFRASGREICQCIPCLKEIIAEREGIKTDEQSQE